MKKKMLVGAFAAILGGMAVKVFKTMKDNKQEEIVEEDEIEYELQN